MLGSKYVPKSGLKLVFFAIFSTLVHQFSFKLHRMTAWNNYQLLAELKSTKKIEGRGKFGPNRPKLGPKLGFFEVWFISFPGNCIDNSLIYCITTTGGVKPTKKILAAHIWSNGPKLGLKLGFVSFSQVSIISFP